MDSVKRKVDPHSCEGPAAKRVMFTEDDPFEADSCVSSLEDSSQTSDGDDEFLTSALDDDNSDDGDFTSKFDFLNSKQAILSRVSEVLGREESYAASVAICTAKKTVYPPSELLKEARSILWSLGLRTHASEPVIKPKIPKHHSHRSQPNPKHPAIDSSRCERVHATKWNQRQRAIEKESRSTNTLLNLPTSIFCKGQWMAQALVWSAPYKQRKENHNGDDFRWKVVSNPTTQSLGLLPPTGISMENAIDIQKAVSISDEARIVSQSTPPFCVVYANRAFLELAEVRCKDLIIGRPAESIIHVSTPSLDALSQDALLSRGKKFLHGSLCLNKETMCRISVTPVVDRDRKKDPESIHPKPAKRSERVYACMSHILIQVFERSA